MPNRNPPRRGIPSRRYRLRHYIPAPLQWDKTLWTVQDLALEFPVLTEREIRYALRYSIYYYHLHFTQEELLYVRDILQLRANRKLPR